ncbi:MAG: hypothetical protein AB1772_08595 [Candidatus Zixiibacteriota bacterium]
MAAIVINLPPHQIVGYPLVGQASLLLLDENGMLLTSYDLAASPVTLSCSVGALEPSLINDPSLFSGGIINLTTLQIRYLGPSGPVAVTVSTGGVTSSAVLVSFSGYDIAGVIGLDPDSVSTIYSNTATAVQVRVANGGDQPPVDDPGVKAYFRSGGGSVKFFFDPRTDGREDTVLVDLPTANLPAGADTLMLVLESYYRPNGVVTPVKDTLRVPVQVMPGQGLDIVPATFAPDSVYSGIPFDVSFKLSTGGMAPSWDSAHLVVELLSDGDSVLAVIHSGLISHSMLQTDTITYSDISVQVPPGFPSGVFKTRVDLNVLDGGLRQGLSAPYVDSMLILTAPSLEYLTATLSPISVVAGHEWSFDFDLYLDGSEVMVVSPTESFFNIEFGEFSPTVALQIPSNSLNPGANHISTRRVFIPVDLVDRSMEATARLVFRHSGAANSLEYSTDFNGRTVNVEATPLLQLVEAILIAPNAPLVNTGQSFQVKGRVANLSPTPMTPFDLRLVSDGGSRFDSVLTIPNIPAWDTVDVFFDVRAAPVATQAEIFRIDIATVGVNRLPPVDNIALVTIQRPAELSATAILRGADQGFVEVGQSFDLLLGILNTGEAQATAGIFRINTNGIDLGLPGGATEIEETVPVGTVRGVSFIAPQFDTVVVLDVVMIGRPFDVNTAQPALIGDTVFRLELAVTLEDIEVTVSVTSIPSNVVLPGADQQLAEFRLSNPGTSSVSDIRLVSLALEFYDRGGRPLQARSVVEVGSTMVLFEGRRVTRASAGGNRLSLLFDDLVVPAGDAVDLVLRTKILRTNQAEFSLRLDTSNIKACFATPPLDGVPVPVATATGAGLVLEEVYTLVEQTLAGSFSVRTNPFDPYIEPAEFRYFLPQAQEIDLAILTLTGELVYHRQMPAGQPGGAIGENVVYWDGRNNEGREVVNGVYIVIVEGGDGRDRATLKLAVMK